jgi:hypothetical protein
MRKVDKRTLQVVGVMALAVAIFKVDWWFNSERATQRQETLKKELREVPRYPDSKELSLDSTYKTTAGVLDQRNNAPIEAAALEDWYLSKLPPLGWAIKDSEIRSREKVLRFCRDKEGLNILIPQEKAPPGGTLTYRVQIGWGAPARCD